MTERHRRAARRTDVGGTAERSSAVRATARRRLAPPIRRAWRAVRPRLPDRLARTLSTRARSLVEPSSPVAGGVQCPVCGTEAGRFLPYGVRRTLPDRRCRRCGSLPRHRAVWLFLERRTNLFTEPVRMLHVAPERFLAERIAAHENIDYLTADLDPSRAMVRMDITDMQLPDGSFDVIYASHVLEHIPEDEVAMSELCRVLRPGGWAVLQVPIFGDRTREDPSVVDPHERERLFGQVDHVRMYGHDGEYERRLRAAGFEVEVHDLADELADEEVRRFGIDASEAEIYCCTKPSGT